MTNSSQFLRHNARPLLVCAQCAVFSAAVIIALTGLAISPRLSALGGIVAALSLWATLFAVARKRSVEQVVLNERGVRLLNFKGREVLNCGWSALEYYLTGTGDLLMRVRRTRQHYLLHRDIEEFSAIVNSVIQRATEFAPPWYLRSIDSYRIALVLLAVISLISCFLAGVMPW